jgi:hypothetical protein
MAYEVIRTVKVVRTKHRVTFTVGATVGDLIAWLTKVPPGATVDEVVESIEEGSNVAYIEFHEEKRAE